MPVLKRLAKHKHIPVALLYRGADALGVELGKLLIEQGAYVILIDEYSEKKKDLIGPLLKNDLFSFFDISGVASLSESVERVDYIFYFNHEKTNPDEEVSTREFLDKSNRLDRLLQLGVDKKSKFLLTTSIRLHKLLQMQKEVSLSKEEESLQYNALEVQRYAENLTWEYYKRGGLDARIIRMGELLGEGIDLHEDSYLGKFLKKAISGQKIEVEGDGLENIYFVHILDAAYGLIKAQFTDKASGKIYSLVIPRDITALNLAYKVLDLEPKAAGIDFVEQKSRGELNVYKPASNLKDLGWKPKITFERALAQTIDFAYEFFGKVRSTGKMVVDEKEDEVKKDMVKDIKEFKDKKSIKGAIVNLFANKDKKEEPSTKSNDNLDKFEVVAEEPAKKKSLKNTIVNFFFEVKEEKKPKSILDNVQYKQKTDSQREALYKQGDKVSLTAKQEEHRKEKKKNTFSWKVLNFFERTKKSIRSLSLPTLFGYIFLGVFLLFFYVLVLIPLIRIGYYAGFAYIKMDKVNGAIEEWRFKDAGKSIESVNSSLDNIDNNIDKLSFLSSFKFFDEVENFQQTIRQDKKVLGSLVLLTSDLEVIEQYFSEYESSVNLLGEDNLIAGEGGTYDLSELENINSILSTTRQAIAGYESKSINLNIPLLGNKLGEFQEDVNEYVIKSSMMLDDIAVVPELIALGESKTTAVMMLDDSNLTIRGGEITAVCVFTIDNGQITKIKMYSPSELENKLSTEQIRIVKEEMQGLYPDNGLTFDQLTLVGNESLFFELTSQAIFRSYDSYPNTIITLNQKSLGDIFEILEKIDLASGGSVDNTNYSVKIKEIQLHKEILTKVIKKLTDFNQNTFSHLKSVFSANISTKDLVIYTENQKIKDYFYKESQLLGFSDAISLGLITKSEDYPNIKIDGKVELDKDIVQSEYLLELLNEGTSDFEGTLVVYYGDKFDVSRVETSSKNIEILNENGGLIMLSVKLKENEKAEVLLKGASTDVVGKTASSYNYTLMSYKPFGFLYEYNFDFIYEGYSLTSAPGNGDDSDGIFSVSGMIQADDMWQFSYTAD